MKPTLFLSVLSCLASASILSGAIIVNFNDLPIQPANGLSHFGVVYSYSTGGASSSAALYGAPFTADSLIGNTVLAGPANDPNDPFDSGLLTLNFAAPTADFSFNIALASTTADNFTLNLFGPFGTALAPIPIVTNVDPTCDISVSSCYSETQFVYTGTVPLSGAAFDFASTQASAFAVGAISYDVTTPEPGSSWLFGGGAGLLIVFLRFQRSVRIPRQEAESQR